MARANNDGDPQMPVYKNLFEWSMRHYKPDEAPREPLDPERVEFLRNAIKHYTVDVPNRLVEIKQSLERATQQNEEDSEQILALLDELDEHVSNVDFACDFNSLGGLAVVIALFDHPSPEVRAAAAQVLATSTQNHRRAQLEVLEAGCIPPLVRLFEDREGAVVIKALAAAGSIIRGFPEGLAALRGAGGLDRLLSLLSHANDRVSARALRVVHDVLREDEASRGWAASAGVLDKLMEALRRGDTDMDATSAALDAVFSLAKDKSTRQVAAEQQGLAEAVKAVGERIEGMSAEDRDAWREASVLVKLLARFFAAHST